MMERRKALTLPITVDKDNQMENPLKIPVQSLSSNCGKLERQVSWTEFAGYKLRQWDSPHKNGSKLFENSIAAMERRKPRIILNDVLKTELGKDLLEKMKRRSKVEICEPQSSARRESGHGKEKPLASRETRSNQKSEVRTPKNNILTPKCNKKTPPSSSQRSRVSRRSQKADEEEDGDENREIEEVMKSKDKGEDEKFAEVVDCGLSLSWKPSENRESCDEFSPASIKDRLSDPEKEGQHNLKRKRKEPLTQCNGTSSPKRHRESVLRLSGEDGRNRGMGSTQIRAEEESGESRDPEGVDQTIVQFTVGGEDPPEVMLPVVTSNLETGDMLATTNQDSTTKTKPSEPIVLSSDDEEGSEVHQRRSSTVHRLVSVKDSVMQRQTSKEAVMKQQEDSALPVMPDMQVLSVIVDDHPGSVSVIPPHGLSLMNVSFSTLHCGGYMGKSNGDVMITDHNIILPLTDTSEQVELMLMFKRDDLKRYSIWEHQDLEVEGLYFSDGEDPFPAAFLLLCVSESSASAIQTDLVQLGVRQDGSANSGKASPFILITLTEPLEGIKEALLRSFLEMDCLKGLTDIKPIVPQSIESFTDDFQTPALTLDESIELISRTGRDSYLLSLLGLESNDPGLNTNRDVAHCDVAESIAQAIQLEDSSQKEEAPDPGTVADSMTATELKPEEEQKDPEPAAAPSDKKKENITPVYTLCHRRTTGSYSVSFCRPDPSWTKYKHQGIARRLIQFPPPPLKGGITVTMEDLQCLDSGQFLNDVIIDFYLKYLLQNSSESVVERCHIFSSFFYKQLTRRDNASEGVTNDTCQRQRRHQRVKTWTRHVDIFKKDFLFVPVNQEAHWYLVVICFPGLEEPKLEVCNSLNTNNESSNGVAGELQDQEQAHGSKSSNENNTENPPTPGSSDTKDTGTEKPPEESTKDQPPGPVDCTEKTCQKKTVCKRPCILIMDSLKLSLHERVFKLLREYLQSEWEVRRGSSREFGPDQMQSSHCKVPLQDNSSDCGLYLLQYVESFLKDPVMHFDLPLHLERWFPRQQVRRKRDDIRDLILHLFRKQNLNANR